MGLGHNALTTLVTTLPLLFKHTLKLINMAKHVQIHMNTKQDVNKVSESNINYKKIHGK